MVTLTRSGETISKSKEYERAHALGRGISRCLGKDILVKLVSGDQGIEGTLKKYVEPFGVPNGAKEIRLSQNGSSDLIHIKVEEIAKVYFDGKVVYEVNSIYTQNI